jgi:hypothetical protein
MLRLCVGLHTGGSLLPYELDESRNWAMDMSSLKAAVTKARSECKCVRGLVFINPGNPTGQCLSYDNLKVRWLGGCVRGLGVGHDAMPHTQAVAACMSSTVLTTFSNLDTPCLAFCNVIRMGIVIIFE